MDTLRFPLYKIAWKGHGRIMDMLWKSHGTLKTPSCNCDDTTNNVRVDDGPCGSIMVTPWKV